MKMSSFRPAVQKCAVLLLLCSTVMAAVQVQAADSGGGLTIDGSTLHIDISGEPGEWVVWFVPFAEPTDEVEYTMGSTNSSFAAGAAGGAYFPQNILCGGEAGFTPEDDLWLYADPHWLAGGEVEVEQFDYGYGWCSGSDIRGGLFFLGGNVNWSYRTTYTLENVVLLEPILATGSNMQSWSTDVGTLRSDEPTLSQGELSITTDQPGWIHAAVEHEPIARAFYEVQAHVGTWHGSFPSGWNITRTFADATVTSYNGWTMMGSFHQPAGVATATVDMASLDDGARIFFAHIPGLLDAMPFEGTNYNG